MNLQMHHIYYRCRILFVDRAEDGAGVVPLLLPDLRGDDRGGPGRQLRHHVHPRQ